MTLKKKQKPSLEDSSASSTHTETRDVEDEQSDNEIKSDKIIIQQVKYIETSTKSVFNYKDFKIDKNNFERWYDALRRHLIAQDYEDYIDKNIDLKDMNRNQIKSDNAVQSIIINSLDESSQNYLKGCKTAFQMIDRLKSRFYQSGQALLNILEYKINNLEIINNDYILYLNELNNLFEQHQSESEKINKNPLDEETKILYSATELKKVGITTSIIYKFTTFKELLSELIKIHDFDEKVEILKSTSKNLKDININNVNSNIKRNNNKINKNNRNKNYYCDICKLNGHSTDYCKYNNLNKDKNKNQNSNNNKVQNKRKIFRNYNKNNYHTGNINEEENNSYSTSDLKNEDESHIYFTGSVTVSKSNNNNSNKMTHWIIDSGTGISLTNDIKNLLYIQSQ